MSALSPRHRPPRHLAWLLWFVLLLPLAQAASNWHVLSHTAQASQGADAQDETQPQTGHCELCLMAAAIDGGALPAAPIVFLPPTLEHQAPYRVLADVWQAPPAAGYQGRAPPEALH
jgi:hypothetical protein